VGACVYRIQVLQAKAPHNDSGDGIVVELLADEELAVELRGQVTTIGRVNNRHDIVTSEIARHLNSIFGGVIARTRRACSIGGGGIEAGRARVGGIEAGGVGA